MNEENPTENDLQLAAVFLEYWGSSSDEPVKFEGWRYACENYAPEFLSAEELGAEPDDCTTVLDFSLSEVEAPKGWRVAYQYGAGEKDCPNCGALGKDEQTGDTCPMCEGDKTVYWGEECRVVVFAPLKRKLVIEIEYTLTGPGDFDLNDMLDEGMIQDEISEWVKDHDDCENFEIRSARTSEA